MALSRLQEATDYPDSPPPSRCTTPEPQFHEPYIPTPAVSDALASFKMKYGEEFPSEYFEQYSLFRVDQLPLHRKNLQRSG
jgi:hypothetical protein